MLKNMKKGIDASALKWIAVIAMLIDHFAVAIYWQTDNRVYEVYRTLRYVGRISFPIYCFLIVEGFFLTKNIGKYIGRCFLFALISEIPFNMAIHGSVWHLQAQNIYFTLTLGLCTLFFINKIKGTDFLHILGQVAVIAGFSYIAEILEVDYHWKGILFIVMFYYCRNMGRKITCMSGIFAFAHEITAPLAFIPIYFYNGKRGKQLKYLFYFIYPLHLFIYGIIRIMVIS